MQAICYEIYLSNSSINKFYVAQYIKHKCVSKIEKYLVGLAQIHEVFKEMKATLILDEYNYNLDTPEFLTQYLI